MNVSIVPKGSSIGRIISLLGSGYFPNLVKSIKHAANMVQKEWILKLNASSAKAGWKRRYAEAINIESSNNPLSATVSAEGRYVAFVEKGIARRDMKPALLSGPKARQGKNGPYNIIFFRKGVPTTQTMPTMPKNVYQSMRELNSVNPSLSYRTIGIGAPMRMKGDSADIRTQKVRASSLLKRIHSKGTPKLESEEDVGEFEGLMKMGAKGHSQYGTFRVVSKKSKGWIYPGVPKVSVFEPMANSVTPKVKEILQQGLAKDLKQGAEYLEKMTK